MGMNPANLIRNNKIVWLLRCIKEAKCNSVWYVNQIISAVYKGMTSTQPEIAPAEISLPTFENIKVFPNHLNVANVCLEMFPSSE